MPANCPGLEFLATQLVGSKSRSQARINHGHTYTGNFGSNHVLNMRKKNIFDKAGQISRYQRLSKDGTLAHRLNRAMPANTNFPEEGLRQSTGVSGLETSNKYKLSETFNALTNINTSSSKKLLTGRNTQNETQQIVTPKPLTANLSSANYRKINS